MQKCIHHEVEFGLKQATQLLFLIFVTVNPYHKIGIPIECNTHNEFKLIETFHVIEQKKIKKNKNYYFDIIK